MNTYCIAGYPISDELYHHGIKGQRWGIRRYQNDDGSLTEAGRKRYGSPKSIQRALNKIDREMAYTAGDVVKNLNKAYRRSHGVSVTNGTMQTSDKHLREAERLRDKAETLNRSRDTLIKKAIESGYDVRTKDIPRPTVRTGEAALKVLIATGSLGLVTPQITTGIYGTKYYVAKQKK